MRYLDIFKTRKNNEKKAENTDQKLFNEIIKNADYILKNTKNTSEKIHPIFTFVKQITDLITAETALNSYIKGEYYPDNVIPKVIEARFSQNSSLLINHIKISPKKEDKKYYIASGYYYYDENIEINLANFPLVLNPWNSSRISNNIKNVSTEINPFDSRRFSWNIVNVYYYPVGFAQCFGGNHSQYSSKLKGAGTSFIDSIIDVEKVYKYVSFDGIDFCYNFPNDEVKIYPQNFPSKNKLEFYAGTLYEIGRLLLEYPDIFPEQIQNAIKDKKTFEG
ncbi:MULTISPECIES: DUF6710 family protein [Enterococcus]|uniref:DUF6710 family protein n=1 Tax=Enterococcus TaxID=1350 RepID=UPI001E5AFD86|nr:DUF6710 family protein [Enterococcus faecalis]